MAGLGHERAAPPAHDAAVAQATRLAGRSTSTADAACFCGAFAVRSRLHRVVDPIDDACGEYGPTSVAVSPLYATLPVIFSLSGQLVCHRQAGMACPWNPTAGQGGPLWHGVEPSALPSASPDDEERRTLPLFAGNERGETVHPPIAGQIPRGLLLPPLNRLRSTSYRPAGAKLLMSIYQDDVRYRRTMAPLLHLVITSGVGPWGCLQKARHHRGSGRGRPRRQPG